MRPHTVGRQARTAAQARRLLRAGWPPEKIAQHWNVSVHAILAATRMGKWRRQLPPLILPSEFRP